MSLSKVMAVVRRYPVVTTSLTFGILFPTANVIQQTCFKKAEAGGSETLDWAEVARFTVYGGIFHGPLIHNWVNFISKMIPWTTLPFVMVKVMLDQVVFAPVLLSSFLLIMTALEGRTREEAVKQWKEKFLPTYGTAVCVWPLLLAINYKLVPLRFSFIYIAICNFFWIIFLAHQKSRRVPWKSPLLRLFL
jgi:hypothetical protein